MDLENRPGRRIRREVTTPSTVPGGDPSRGGGGGGGGNGEQAPAPDGFERYLPQIIASLAGAGGAGLTFGERVNGFRDAVMQGAQGDLNSVRDYRVVAGRGTWGSNMRSWGGNRKTIGTLLDEARKWNEEQVRSIQTRLWRAGYYDPRAYQGQMPVADGKLDEATSMAYSALLTDSVLREKSLAELLLDGENSFDPTAMGGPEYMGRPGRVGGGGVNVTALSDPAALRQMAERVAIELTGRDSLSDDEKNRVAKAIQGIEASEQGKVHSTEDAAGREAFAAGNASADAQVNANVSAANVGKNGFLADDQLVAVQGGVKLSVNAAAAYQDMRAAAAKDGINLKITDGYRDYQGQVNVRKDKGHKVATADPGTSKHGWGTAIDANVDNPKTFAWLQANAGRFGFVNPEWAKQGGKNYEPWHWEFQGGAGEGPANVSAPGAVGGQSSADVYIPARNVTRVDVNAEARAADVIKLTRGAEVGAHDIAETYNTFRTLMGFGQQPTQTAP